MSNKRVPFDGQWYQWSKVLTPEEIEEIMNGKDPRQVAPENLVGYWPYDDAAVSQSAENVDV